MQTIKFISFRLYLFLLSAISIPNIIPYKTPQCNKRKIIENNALRHEFSSNFQNEILNDLMH